MKQKELQSLIGDSIYFRFTPGGSNLTIRKDQIVGFSYQDNNANNTSKIFLYHIQEGFKNKEIWYYKEEYKDFEQDLKMIQKEFED